MSNLTYTSDLIEDTLTKAGEPTDGTSDYAGRALIYLNRAYTGLCLGGIEFAAEIDEDWLWLRKRPPGVLTLATKITTVASVTNGSTAVILSAAQTLDLDNYFFVAVGNNEWYRVASHTAGSANITLDAQYNGSTNATVTCYLYKLEYNLASDCLRVVSTLKGDATGEIDGCPLQTLEAIYPLNSISEGFPKLFAPITTNVIRISHSPLSSLRVEYQYLAKPTALANTANEEPVVPQEYRFILADIATYYLLVDKHSDKAAALPPSIRNNLFGMAKDNKYNLTKINSKFATTYPRKRFYNYKRTSESGLLIP